jgi:hypothetical protein
MSTTTPTTEGTEVCDGENLAIILALYWVVYLIINGVIFAVAMYALRKFFDKIKLPGGKNKKKDNLQASRANSRISLISRGNN